MKAMILAAGFGTRLRPLTHNLPKPMFPVMNRPIMEHILEFLRSRGIGEIMINLHHLPEKVTEHFGNGRAFGVELNYLREKNLLGTAGALRAAGGFLRGGPFLVINSDILTDIDLDRLLEFHRKKNSCLTLVLKPGDSPECHDPIEIGADGRIVHFVGASSMNIPEITSRVTFTGIQIMEPEILERIPQGRFCGTTDEIFPQMVEDGVEFFGYLHEGYWRDMGTRAGYLQLHRDIFEGKLRGFAGWEAPPAVDPRFIPPVLIGRDCRVAETARVGPYAVLGNRCRILDRAVVEDSVCWDDAVIGAGARMRRSIAGSGAAVKDQENLDDRSVT